MDKWILVVWGCHLFTFPIWDGVLERSPQPTGVRAYHPWWQLFVGRRTRYICNFAIKMEPICQLQCPHDCTAVLSLLSNEHALKSGTFSVPGMVLSGCDTTWHKFWTSREIRDGWQPCRGQFPVLSTWACLTVPPPSVTIQFRHFGLFWIC